MIAGDAINISIHQAIGRVPKCACAASEGGAEVRHSALLDGHAILSDNAPRLSVPAEFFEVAALLITDIAMKITVADYWRSRQISSIHARHSRQGIIIATNTKNAGSSTRRKVSMTFYYRPCFAPKSSYALQNEHRELTPRP